LRRHDVDLLQIQAMVREKLGLEFELAAEVAEQLELEVKYAGYIHRQAEQIERFQKLESKMIPLNFDFLSINQLRREAREKFHQIRPTSIGQAGRISGISPADIAVLLMILR
jgi:tRNA uridine 5-carboxymethylaminomethyl modification enzyme